MRRAFGALLSVCLLVVIVTASVNAADGWQFVGSPGFSEGNISDISIALDGSTPYVAYKDFSNDFKATVMRFNGSEWEPVGQPGLTPGQASYLSLALDGSTPYISFSDSTQFSRVSVMRFNDTEWEYVGSPGFTAPYTTYTTIAFDGSTPYVSYRGWFPQKANVMRFTGTEWEMVGDPDFTPTMAQYLTMALDGSTPYVAYLDNANGYRANVMRLNGDSWEFVGPPDFSPDRADNIQIALDESTPYVSYQDYANEHKATVMRFNGTDWEAVGGPGLSPGRVFFPSFALDGSTPYVAFMDEKSGYKTSVMRFNGTEWEVVGSPGFYAGLAFDPTLALDGSTPYVVFQVIGSGFRATAMKYDQFPTVTRSTPADGGERWPIRIIKVRFDRDMLHDGSVDAANNPANYLLVEANGDGFQTESCADGVEGNDIHIPVLSVDYENYGGGGPYKASLNMDRLVEGEYQLLVCGTTSIYDTSGNIINGGADAIITFRIDPALLPESADTLPQTGFTPGRQTRLPRQSEEAAYQKLSQLSLEIPALGTTLPIAGVPLSENGWELTWLGRQAGWLHGSVFPGWAGNSAITAHAVDANGEMGPFSDLADLNWGDEIIVHAFGQSYVYQVRSIEPFTAPEDTSQVFRHEEYPWLTLITCRGYDPESDGYRWRVVVRAVQTEIR